ncbi:MAG: GLUG motif-containing protein, partial [bacterium]
QFKAAINAGLGGNYMLMNDIDMSELGTVNRAVITGYFTGTLDGNGYKIKNLTITSNADYSGLFSITDGANIKNLILENTNISVAGVTVFAGGLAGFIKNSIINNCSSTNVNINANQTQKVGGFIGGAQTNNTITNCYSTGTISGSDYTGGLIGQNFNTSNISLSFSSVSVTGTIFTGGLVGAHYGTCNLYDSYATGSVIASGSSSGGLIGAMNTNSSVTSSYATGNVSSSAWASGGLIGSSNTNSTITSCYATGNVSSTSTSVGGLIGANYTNSTITASYSSGNITGTNYVGGLVGYNSTSVINSSYSSSSVLGLSQVGGLIGFLDMATINSSYALGETRGNDKVGGFVGDCTNSTINSSSSSGKVTATSNFGGFAGTHTGASIDNTNFWNKDSSGQATSAGSAIGKTSAQFDAMTPVTSTWNSTDWDTTFENPVLKAIKNGNINMQTGAEATKNSCYALKDMGLNFGGELAISLDSISSAQSAISSIDKVMTYLSSKRSDIGVGINALSGRLDTNSTRKENFISSSGVLKDTDMAVESAKFTKQQILRNMGMSMLQQSKNMQTNSIQQLLGL